MFSKTNTHWCHSAGLTSCIIHVKMYTQFFFFHHPHPGNSISIDLDRDKQDVQDKAMKKKTRNSRGFVSGYILLKFQICRLDLWWRVRTDWIYVCAHVCVWEKDKEEYDMKRIDQNQEKCLSCLSCSLGWCLHVKAESITVCCVVCAVKDGVGLKHKSGFPGQIISCTRMQKIYIRVS